MAGLCFHFLARHLDFSAASCIMPHRDWSPVLSSLWNGGRSTIWLIVQNEKPSVFGDKMMLRLALQVSSSVHISWHSCATDYLISGVPSAVFWRWDSWPPVVRILKHSLPVEGKGRFGSTLKELKRLVMALWTTAAAHASHTQQLSSAQDLAEVPHDALNIPDNPNASEGAVHHRDSEGSFAPQETSSITDCNVKHNTAMLHRRCARVCHIFQDISTKMLSRACWLHLTQVNFSRKVQKGASLKLFCC